MFTNEIKGSKMLWRERGGSWCRPLAGAEAGRHDATRRGAAGDHQLAARTVETEKEANDIMAVMKTVANEAAKEMLSIEIDMGDQMARMSDVRVHSETPDHGVHNEETNAKKTTLSILVQVHTVAVMKQPSALPRHWHAPTPAFATAVNSPATLPAIAQPSSSTQS